MFLAIRIAYLSSFQTRQGVVEEGGYSRLLKHESGGNPKRSPKRGLGNGAEIECLARFLCDL